MTLPRLALAAALVLLHVAHASADATAFVGSVWTPNNRAAKGLSVGFGLFVVGAEFEWSAANEVATDGTPSLRTGSGNLLLQSPLPVFGFQPYVTTGIGAYSERLREEAERGLAFNSGLGVKISLLGPIRARVDYRTFRLRGEPRYPTVHRTYVGLNISF